MTTDPTARAAAPHDHGYWAAPDGLATLGPELVEVRDLLETRIRDWAAEIGGAEMVYPPLLRVADLEKIDYFANFPHLGMIVSHIGEEHLERVAEGAGHHDCIHAAQLADAGLVLPSAACYGVYFHLQDRVLSRSQYITTVVRCFRKEAAYDRLRRLLGFSMREIVCVGTREDVLAHLKTFREKIADYAGRIGLPLKIEAASDPFFSKDAARTAMQQLFPVKEEFVFDGDLAIASVNFHRNFFGERCNIKLTDGSPVFTGCVAFGLERWLQALVEHYEGDFADIRAALAAGE